MGSGDYRFARGIQQKGVDGTMADQQLSMSAGNLDVVAEGAAAPEAGMFDLARLEGAPPSGWWLAIPPAVVAWLGGVAFLGQFRANEVAEAIAGIAPLGLLFWGCLGVAAVGALGTAVLGRGSQAVLWAGVLGYLAGHLLFAAVPVHQAVRFSIPFTTAADGFAFAGHRLVYGLCLAVCVGGAMCAAAWATGAWPKFYLGVGSWSALGRDFTYRSKPETYRQAMLGFALFAAILWIVGQMSVELKPLRSGLLWGLLPVILIGAMTNALIEEVIYRGLLQPAFLQAAGIARGIWLQAILFGMLHWGLSVGMVAALPTSLLIGLGAVFWGKSMLDTRGISWVICAHAMVDVAIMCAYFVP